MLDAYVGRGRSGVELLKEVERFRTWAATIPAKERNGEWECDYAHWASLGEAVVAFINRHAFAAWTPEQLDAVLYALARDNEGEDLARTICARGDELVLNLAEAALRCGEQDAKWQLAEALGHVQAEAARRDWLLKALARDEHEYVRRRALRSLVAVGSPAAEEVALEAWSRPDEAQEWARMMALWALQRIGSAKLESLLAAAERDGGSYLSGYAVKIRRGEVEQ